MSITRAQQDMLLAPLARQRVEKRDGFDYLNVSDVRRYLIRIFGFGGWSYTTDEAQLVSQREVEKRDGGTQWEVVWKVRVTLTIPALDVVFSEYATGTNTQPNLPKAHDSAIKSAESDALKRAAVNLGDQFGLSLYFGDKRSSVFHSVQRVYAEPHVSDNPIDRVPEVAVIEPEQDVQAIPEADLTVRPEADYTYDGDAAGADDDSTGPDVTLPQVADLPEDFWQQMDAIRAATSKAKRLKLASDYRKTILGLGLTSGHPVMTPNGTAITIGAAFDTAIGGA